MRKEDFLMNSISCRLQLTAALSLVALAALPGATFAANVTGKAKFEGERPRRFVIKMDADPKCAAIHGETRVPTEDAIVDREGNLQNVFVYIKSGLGDKKFDPPSTPAKIDQVGCIYVPHVQGMMVNQNLEIVNSDPTAHNIHCLAKTNPEFNFGQTVPGTQIKVFRRSEEAVKFKCDIHPWMGAFIFVLEHPFFAVSEKDGSFTIKDLPDGKYTLAAWHEKYGEQTVEITVSGADVTQDFTFKE